MSSKFVIKGINSDVDTCGCCGKTNLKRVIWLAAVDADGCESDPIAYGANCGAMALGFSDKKYTAKTIGDIKTRKDRQDEVRARFDRALKSAHDLSNSTGEIVCIFRYRTGGRSDVDYIVREEKRCDYGLLGLPIRTVKPVNQ